MLTKIFTLIASMILIIIGIGNIFSSFTFIIILIHIILIINIYESYEKDSRYTEDVVCPIFSKETYRTIGETIYKLNFYIKGSIFDDNYIYVTKEEYKLLKTKTEIPFLYNTETKSIKINEKKFYELIKTLKDKEDTK